MLRALLTLCWALGASALDWDRLIALDARFEHTQPSCKTSVRAQDNCYPQPDLSKKRCMDRGCCWREANLALGLPMCYFPTNYGHHTQKLQHVQHLAAIAGLAMLACAACACGRQCVEGVRALCPCEAKLERYTSINPYAQNQTARTPESYQLVSGKSIQVAPAGAERSPSPKARQLRRVLAESPDSGHRPIVYQSSDSAAQPPEDEGSVI
eukprot:g3891.t1